MSLMKPKIEQRQYSLRTAYIMTEYTVLEGTYRDFIRNIGTGGLFISTDRKVAVGQPIAIEFPLFTVDNLIEIRGRVVRKDPEGVAVTCGEAMEGLICKEGHFPEIVHGSNR
jgi:Tfp pilus assembly protein PilZ